LETTADFIDPANESETPTLINPYSGETSLEAINV